jgi:phosphate butyryltransferase
MNQFHTFDEVRARAVEIAQQHGPLKLALACAEDVTALQALRQCLDLGLVVPTLVGDQGLVSDIAAQAQVDLTGFEIIHEKDYYRAAVEAVNLTASGQTDLLMKGRIMVYEFLHAALHHGAALRQGKRLWSHVGLFWPKALERFLLVTDGGMVVDPAIELIPRIIENAMEVTVALGIEKPRVALLAAVETVYANMPVAMGGAVIAKMADRGQIKGVSVDGPLSLDVAISPEAAREKGVGGEVAGRADMLVVNKIEVGNALYKSIFIFGQARSAGLVVGPRSPFILNSRSETADSRINSICLATLMVKR